MASFRPHLRARPEAIDVLQGCPPHPMTECWGSLPLQLEGSWVSFSAVPDLRPYLVTIGPFSGRARPQIDSIFLPRHLLHLLAFFTPACFKKCPPSGHPNLLDQDFLLFHYSFSAFPFLTDADMPRDISSLTYPSSLPLEDPLSLGPGLSHS